MAYCKGTELRAKLSGLLIDRVEVIPVDLVGALQRAEGRGINVSPLSLASGGSIDWCPHIAGNPVADADGESDRQVKHLGPENR